MHLYSVLIILIAASAAFAYINYRFIKMPFVIGMFFLSTLLSLLIIISKFFISAPFIDFKLFVEETHISDFVLNILLGFLLFAGALHTDWSHIRQQLKQIALFAIGGVIFSTIVIASLLFGLGLLLNISLPFIYCLIFGALISPTDPIAVLGILTKAKVPKKIESIIVGESLFNDGVGVVIFIALLELLNIGISEINFAHFGFLFLQEAVGGIAFGLLVGYFLYRLLKSIDHYGTEVILTLAFVMVGYQLCRMLHISGPLAMVVMGLFVGNFKKHRAMSDATQEYVHKFWELVDVILNAILFNLIALVLVVIDFTANYLIIGLIAIIIVLMARILVVYFPMISFPKIAKLNRNEARIIVWGGLRGGLSIALVLSLPPGEEKNILLVADLFLCTVQHSCSGFND